MDVETLTLGVGTNVGGQIGDVLNEAGKIVNVSAAIVFGGMPKRDQIVALASAVLALPLSCPFPFFCQLGDLALCRIVRAKPRLGVLLVSNPRLGIAPGLGWQQCRG